MTTHLILASASPRRIEILENLGLTFTIQPSDQEEVTQSAQTPAEIVLELAKMKAERVMEIIFHSRKELLDCEELVFLAADTIVVLDGEVLGKPRDADDARLTLSRLSDNQHEVYSGVHVIHTQKAGNGHVINAKLHDFDSSQVIFTRLSSVEIESYIATGEPMDKAGSYAVQGIGSFMIASINGCYTNVIGLPVPRTVSLLRQCGLKIMGL
jgi:septum formation protein